MKLIRFHDTNFDDAFQYLMAIGLYETAVIQYAEEKIVGKIFLTPKEWEMLYDNEIIPRPLNKRMMLKSISELRNHGKVLVKIVD